MDNTKVTEALRGADINLCGVALCETGKYFDIIPRAVSSKEDTGDEPEKEAESPPKSDGVEGKKQPLEKRVLSALPKIFGNLEYELK